jgi:multidrug efflux pump subunit AcrA (membrane-fusion protein)
MINRKLIGIVIIAVVVLVIVFVIINTSKSTDNENEPAASNQPRQGGGMATVVDTVPVRQGGLESVVKLTGEVQAARLIKVYPDVAGKVMNGTVPVGMMVSQNQIVARVDPSRPGSDFEPNPVRSPVSGMVTAVLTDPGTLVSTNTVLLEVSSMNELEVVVRVPERYVADIVRGMPAVVVLNALQGRMFDVSVSSIDPVLDPATRSKRILFRLSGNLAQVSPGMFAEVSIKLTSADDMLLVPRNSLVRRGGDDLVYVVSEGLARERIITIGTFSDDFVEVTKGLSADERVIVRGQNLIRNGSRVQPVNVE